MYHCGSPRATSSRAAAPRRERQWNSCPTSPSRRRVRKSHAAPFARTAAPCGAGETASARPRRLRRVRRDRRPRRSDVRARRGRPSPVGNDYRSRTPRRREVHAALPNLHLFCGLRRPAPWCAGELRADLQPDRRARRADRLRRQLLEVVAGHGRACGIDATHHLPCLGRDPLSEWPLEGRMMTKLAFGSATPAGSPTARCNASARRPRP